MTTSIDSLADALSSSDRAAQLLYSPGSTKCTGDTGSSESHGHASRSLIASVKSRALLSSHFSDPSVASSTPETLSGDDRAVDDSARPGSPSQILRMYTHSSGDGSWSQVSRAEGANPQQRTEELSDEGESSAESSSGHDELGTRITASQEEAGLQHTVTRSQSDFSMWLADTMAHARGDGTSTVDSEEFQAVASATRRARTGLGYSDEELQFPLSRLGVEDVTARFDVRSQDHSSARPEEDILDQSEILSFQLEDSLAVPPTELAPPAEVTPNEGAKAALTPTLSVSKEEVRWKALSICLGVALLANAMHAYGGLSLVKGVLQSLSAFKRDSPAVDLDLDAHIGSLYLNVTRNPPPATFGKPLTSTGAMIIATLLIAISSAYLVYLNSLPPPKRVRYTSPLLEMDPVSIIDARELIEEATHLESLGRLDEACTKLDQAASMRCAPKDKAIASERLGNLQFRIALSSGSDEMLRKAVASSHKAVRVNPDSATARASWGRALFHLGDYQSARRPLEIATRKDETLAMAFEYLGKTLIRLGEVASGEVHLHRAIELDPTSYTSLAFLGDHLHSRGQSADAQRRLEAAVQLRHDYPSAHARLAFIATEQLSPELAQKHLRIAIASRDEGYLDRCLEKTSEAIEGSKLFLTLYFAIAKDDFEGRGKVVERAKELYPNDTILSVLLAINQVGVKDKEGKEQLEALEKSLKWRVERYEEDFEARGLLALVLAAMGKRKKAVVEYNKFWERMGKDKEAGGKSAFLVMAFYELSRQASGKAVERPVRRQVALPTPESTPTRQTRAQAKAARGGQA